MEDHRYQTKPVPTADLPPVRKAETDKGIPSGLNSIHRVISRLYAAVEAIENRLGPVLGQDAPSVGKEVTSGQSSSDSPLAMELQAMADKLENLDHVLHRLYLRMDLP